MELYPKCRKAYHDGRNQEERVNKTKTKKQTNAMHCALGYLHASYVITSNSQIEI